MISIVGNYLLLLSMLSSVFTILLKDRSKFYSFILGSVLPLIAFAMLVSGFVLADFSLKNVFFNSSLNKSLIFKIAGSWASHEGSMLLWFCLLSLVSMIYVISLKIEPKINDLRITIIAFIQILFLSFIYFTSNPFEPFNFKPQDGLGLNPVLQDAALSIHPPILYLGYVCYAVLFTNGCLILLYDDNRDLLIQNSKFFSSLALTALSGGIALGSWWAYRELGWGGFWFFDPVENISLMPWLSGIALHHFLITTIKYQKYYGWSILLSILSFLITIYGMFFVRSGIVSSVHSFAFSPEKGMYIFVICLILTIFSLTLFTCRRKYLPNRVSSNIKLKAIFTGNMLWLISMILLLTGVVYPVYYLLFHEMDIAIDPKYYHNIFIPVYIPIMLLATVSPYLAGKLSKRHYLLFISAGAIAMLLASKINMAVISGSIIFASIYLMLQMLDYLLTSTNYFKNSITGNQAALFSGHFGMGLLAFAISINVILADKITFNGKVGDQISKNNINVKLERVKFAENDSYYRQIAEFSIQDKNDNIVILKPENRLYKTEKSFSPEADIFSFLTYDLYAVLSQVENKIIYAEIYYRPLMSFIWLACEMIAFGFLLMVFKNPK